MWDVIDFQARSQPVFSGKPGMISRDHFVCPISSFSEMKETGWRKLLGFQKTGKPGLTCLTSSYAPDFTDRRNIVWECLCYLSLIYFSGKQKNTSELDKFLVIFMRC